MSDAYDRMDETLRAWDGFSGVVTLRRKGIVEFEGCYGLANRADGVPITPATRFGLASLSKMYTAATIGTLVRDGKVAFATPVADVVPPERRPATLRPDVTVAHLLTHTSGIADYYEEEDEPEGGYASLWVDRPVGGILHPVDFLPMYGHLEPYRPPGEKWQYSNAGFVLLAQVVEELTGQEFPAAVAERVFGPAGMSGSGYFRTDDVLPDVAVGYLPEGRTNVHALPVRGGGDGGALSTSEDIDRFLRAWDDGTLTGRALRDEMLGVRFPLDVPNIDMGYGPLVYAGGRFGHGGGDPGVNTLCQRSTPADVSVVILCNMQAEDDHEDEFVGIRNDLMAAATQT